MNDTVAPPDGSAAYVSLQYGSNGDPNGSPEMSIGTSDGDVSDGRYTWDSSSSGPFDSGDTPFVLIASPNSNGTEHIELDVGWGSSGTSISADLPFSSVSAIEIDAGLQNNAAVSATGVDVVFTKNGDEDQNMYLGDDPSLDLSDSSDPLGETVAQVTDGATGDNGVVVQGDLQLSAPDGVYPAASDLFLSTYIFA